MGVVVMKFGGTSVASAEHWPIIASQIRARRAEGHRVWVTASALATVSNTLEAALNAAVDGRPSDAWARLRRQHVDLAQSFGLDLPQPVADLLEDLARLLDGIRLTAEASNRLRARVMSFGELASTRLGVAILMSLEVEAQWMDARAVLTSLPMEGAEAHLKARVTVAPKGSVECPAPVVLTQGFIAREPGGATVLLGRGGSDTSASLFGAMLGAERVEIWTDVHGMFTSNPREIPTARQLLRLDYRQAQELAAMGAKVLHPRCLEPVARYEIPLHIRNTEAPDAPGTVIEAAVDDSPTVTAVVRRDRVTLVSLRTLEMWGAAGFLADTFAVFARHGMSVDLVATSQSAVSVTLDHVPGGPGGAPFGRMLAELEALGHVDVIPDAAVVSIVGRRIRAVLHELGSALAVFREHDVHLVSESSEDLNLSFVVDTADAPRLVQRLHGVLFPPQGAPGRLGRTWEQLKGARVSSPSSIRPRWWQGRESELHRLCPEGARYVYDSQTVREQASGLVNTLTAADRIYYATKANGHPELLAVIAEQGLGMECVSIEEVEHVRNTLGPDVPILFTPNFCPVEEYARAWDLGAEVTIDGPDVVRAAPEVFRGRSVAIRIDPGGGAGHHEKVVTAGAQAKFGHPSEDLRAVLEPLRSLSMTVCGLHAHVGSGILTTGAWHRTGTVLGELASEIPELEWIDLGGGLGVPERPGQTPLDLEALQASLLSLRAHVPRTVSLRLEPGRYLVSEAGVLLARVTQVRTKGAVRFIGLATGMNSLIRPALYGAWHQIHNISRPVDASRTYAHVVGPICETGDILGRNRLLPQTEPDDLLLIDNAGAYGRVMSSHYNRRAPAKEVVI